MKYEDFEKAQELRDEISKLQAITDTLAPDEYKDEEPVRISRVSNVFGDDHYSTPVSIPADIARELSAMVWMLVERKEKEFKAL